MVAVDARWMAVGARLRRANPERYEHILEEIERAVGCRDKEK